MDPLWSETCWSTFKYFIILIVSTYYILCMSSIIKCLIDKGCRICVTPSKTPGIKFRAICVIAIKDEVWIRFHVVVFLIIWWLRASTEGRHVSCQALRCALLWTPVTYLITCKQWHRISLSCAWRNAKQFQEACQITVTALFVETFPDVPSPFVSTCRRFTKLHGLNTAPRFPSVMCTWFTQ